jgi:RHS repeat-associated protein
LPENGNFTDPHNHYTLTGKEFDENTGLVWFGARHYEPETGVWMGQDVYRGRLSQPMSLRRYGYVLDNPVTLWDWYGYYDPDHVKIGDNQVDLLFKKNIDSNHGMGGTTCAWLLGGMCEANMGYDYENHDAPFNNQTFVTTSVIAGVVVYEDEDFHYGNAGLEYVPVGVSESLESNWMGIHLRASLQCNAGLGLSVRSGIAKFEEGKYGASLDGAIDLVGGLGAGVGGYFDLRMNWKR